MDLGTVNFDDLFDFSPEPAGGNGARLLSTILYIGDNLEQIVDSVSNVIKQSPSNCACWKDRLIIRLMSSHSASARKDIEKLLLAIRKQPMPRVWQT